MDIEQYRSYCLSKKGSTESFPFNEDTLVFKVMGKIFAICGLERFPHEVNMKCDPDRAIELREKYESIKPGYHMNKSHWNTVALSGGVKHDILINLIDHSYDLVVAGLTKKLKQELLDI